MKAFSIAGTSKMPSKDGIQFGAMVWTAKNKRQNETQVARFRKWVIQKLLTFPVNTCTRNRNISLGIPILWPLLMSGPILSWERKHILAPSVDRPPNKDQDFMHKGGRAAWASPEHASIILSSDMYISSKHCRQISPSASTVGWIIWVIDCRWPNVAFIYIALRPIMSTTWHD